MSDLWFPGTDRSRPAPTDGGSILGGPPKCLWHDTESNGLPSYSTGSFPNMTLDPVSGRTWQHIPADRAARALRNPSGGVQTNRWNVFQVEVIGWVNRVPFHPVMAEVARWLREVRGTPLQATVDWLPFDASFGASRVRLSGAAWNSYTGHLGHMHAPENDHGDPGWPFPIDQIIAGEETDMYDADAEERLFRRIEEAERRTSRYVDHGDASQTGTANHHARIREDLAALRAILEAGLSVTLSLADATPQQLADLGKAIADNLEVAGHPTLQITGVAVPAGPAEPLPAP